MAKQTKYYLAYGSNMDVEQMFVRCPESVIAGKAILKNWRLVFKYHADVIPHIDCEVPVLVWRITNRDERNLDYYEGFPDYYIKKEVSVEMTNLTGAHPQTITAMIYVMKTGHKICLPAKHYYDCILAGYERFRFDTSPLTNALQEVYNYMSE